MRESRYIRQHDERVLGSRHAMEGDGTKGEREKKTIQKGTSSRFEVMNVKGLKTKKKMREN